MSKDLSRSQTPPPVLSRQDPAVPQSPSDASTLGGDAPSQIHYVDIEAQTRSGGLRRQGSVASRLSEKDIYPDLNEEERQLRREQTLEELRSVYSRRTQTEGELDAPDDAADLAVVDPELVTWDGPDDLENPRNFPRPKKWKITMIVSLYTFVSPFGSSIAAPAAQGYIRDFGITNSTIASMSVSIFLLGFAVGPLFFAPLSEMYGRLPVMHISTIIFFFFTIGCAVAQSTTQLIVLRFFSGIAGSAPLALGAGILSDIWPPMELARASALFALGPLIGPICAPIMAGFIVQEVQWRWVFWILAIVVGVTVLAGFVFYREETYAVVLLNRKAAKLRKETGNTHLHTVFETTRSVKLAWKIALIRPFKLLVLNPILLGLGLFMAFVYGFLYLMFVTFPSLFQGVYGQSPGIAGLNYIAPGLGFFIGLGIFTPLMQHFFRTLTEKNNGVSEPEFRLPILFIGGILIPIGLFWYGWSAEKHIHWIMPLIGASIFCCGMISVFSSIQTYLIDMTPRYAASAISAATVFRSLFGFAFPLFGIELYNSLGYGWGNSLLAFVAIPLGLGFPFFVYKYGKPLREAADQRLDRSEARAIQKDDERTEKKSIKSMATSRPQSRTGSTTPGGSDRNPASSL